MAEIGVIPSGSTWSPATTDELTEDAGYASTPADYPISGYFSRSDGEVVKAANFDLTYREMVEGCIENKPYRYEMEYDEKPSLEWLISELPASYLRFYDSCDHAQGDPKPWEAIFRAQVLRHVKGWKHDTALHRFLKAKPFLVTRLGFEDIPDQSTLWRAWEYRLTKVQDAVKEAAETVVKVARYHDIPAPDPGFLPDPRQDKNVTERTERNIAGRHAKEIWQQAKPFVTDCFELDRADNAEIHENAFWEQHAYMGMREDMHANGGADCFDIDTNRERTPSGSTHRHHLKKFSLPKIREMLHGVNETLAARARMRNEFQHWDDIHASIDITKGKVPFQGQIARDSNGNIKEPWILGYKNGELYFQYAAIKIVGFSLPLILDMVPVYRGREREEIVDQLLSNALDIVPEIDGVMMDREFDGDGIKNVCDDHGVQYLNPARVYSSSEIGQHIRKMERNGEPLRIVEQKTLSDQPSRKLVFMPKTASDDNIEDEVDDSLRQELLDDMFELGLSEEPDSGEKDHPFGDIVDEVREGEEIAEAASDLDIVAFETNFDGLDPDASTTKQFHQIRRLLRQYSHRWGIENGFKKIKQFVVRTTSRDPVYRYFNMAFAAVLYNVWRLVDRKVKLELEENPDYSPRITAGLFLTIAKDYFGLDPPD